LTMQVPPSKTHQFCLNWSPYVRLVHDYRDPHVGAPYQSPAVPDHALHYFKQGSGWYRNDGQVHAISPGLVVLVRPGTPYEFQFEPDPPPHMLNTHFDLVEMEDSHHPFPYPAVQRRIPPPAIPADPAVDGYLPSVQQLRDSLVYEQTFYRLHAVGTLPGLAYELTRKALLLELLRMLHDNQRVSPHYVTPVHREMLAASVRFMQDRLEAPLTVADIVAHVHVSRALLARCFRNAYGTSPARYLAQLRIEKAKTELTYGARPIKEIAVATGFASVQHFTRVFHRLTGMPPATFRRRHDA